MRETASYEHDGLVISVARGASDATISWSGESDGRNPGDFINPLMGRLVKSLSGLNVIIDFSRLAYMNSATVAPLISCIKAFDAVSLSVLCVFSDMDWQRTHVQCVRAISRSLSKVRIDVKPMVATSKRPV